MEGRVDERVVWVKKALGADGVGTALAASGGSIDGAQDESVGGAGGGGGVRDEVESGEGRSSRTSFSAEEAAWRQVFLPWL